MPPTKPRSSAATNGTHKSHPTARLLGQQLIDAAGEGDVSTIRKLIAKGVLVNHKNTAGETALTFAAAWNQRKAAKALLELGANPNLADKTGGTALMLAAQHGSPDLVELLLEAGADATAHDKAGNSVLAHADWRTTGDKNQIRTLIRNFSQTKLPVGA